MPQCLTGCRAPRSRSSRRPAECAERAARNVSNASYFVLQLFVTSCPPARREIAACLTRRLPDPLTSCGYLWPSVTGRRTFARWIHRPPDMSGRHLSGGRMYRSRRASLVQIDDVLELVTYLRREQSEGVLRPTKGAGDQHRGGRG